MSEEITKLKTKKTLLQRRREKAVKYIRRHGDPLEKDFDKLTKAEIDSCVWIEIYMNKGCYWDKICSECFNNDSKFEKLTPYNCALLADKQHTMIKYASHIKKDFVELCKRTEKFNHEQFMFGVLYLVSRIRNIDEPNRDAKLNELDIKMLKTFRELDMSIGDLAKITNKSKSVIHSHVENIVPDKEALLERMEREEKEKAIEV